MPGEPSAVAAAQAVAREHGVACDEAVRIAAGSNELVHLKPAPVAAQTLWRFVPHDEQAPPPQARELGRSLRELHVALAGFAGDLAPLSEIRDWLGRLLAELRPSPALTQRDIDSLRSELDALTPAVFESSLSPQALHGDASMSNLLRTDGGLVWNDLEDVCAGPVAWDIAGLVASARARGHSATFVEELLAAYGGPGLEDLEAFLEAHALYEVVWHAFEGRRDRRPG